MQVLSAHQISQLQSTRVAMWTSLVLIEDTVCEWIDRVFCALTSDRAFTIYRTTWNITKYLVCLTMAAAFFSGVLARRGWDELSVYVDRCQEQSEDSPVIEKAVEHPPILGVFSIKSVEDVPPNPVTKKKRPLKQAKRSA